MDFEVLELRELSLAINTPEGMVIVVNCSHPRVERIVNEAAAIYSHIHMIAGEFHLVTASDADIGEVVSAIHDTYIVEYIVCGHCTGEPHLLRYARDLDREGLRWGEQRLAGKLD